MRNREIREAIAGAGLLYWQVAEQIGITDGNFSRLLRHELTGEKKLRVMAAIERAVVENKREAQ